MEDRLQKFVRLVEVGSFTKAAANMHVSQPALTIAISKLEKELGTQLLNREGHSIGVTEAGQAVYEAGCAQAIMLENLKTRLEEISQKKPTIRVGMVDTVAAAVWVFQKSVEKLGEKSELSITVQNSDVLEKAVAKRDIDIAITFEMPHADPKIESRNIGEEQLVLVCSPSKRQLAQKSVEANLIRDYIGFTHMSSTEQSVQKTLRQKNIQVESSLQATSADVILRSIVSGMGVGFLPYVMVRSQLLTGALVPLLHCQEPLKIRQGLQLITQKNRQHPHIVQAFIAEVETGLLSVSSEADQVIAAAQRNISR